MTERPAYSVTPYGEDVAHDSSRRAFVRVVDSDGRTIRTMRAADAPHPYVSRRRSFVPPAAASGVELVLRIDDLVMRKALDLADGDARRLVLNSDGSVTVLNGVRR